MKIFILALLVSTTLYSDYYKNILLSCDRMFVDYKTEYSLLRFGIDKCNNLGRYDLLNSNIKEPEDIRYFLEYQKNTLGIACKQVKQKQRVYFKSEYCGYYELYMLNLVNEVQRGQSRQNAKQEQDSSVYKPKKKPNYSQIYKSSPQIKTSKVHIFDIKNITPFRDKKDIVLIEASSGNYALPIDEVGKSEKINFTLELSGQLDLLAK